MPTSVCSVKSSTFLPVKHVKNYFATFFVQIVDIGQGFCIQRNWKVRQVCSRRTLLTLIGVGTEELPFFERFISPSGAAEGADGS